MANTLFPLTATKMLNNTFSADLSSGALTVKCVLVSSTYTYSTAHDFFDDVSGVLSTATLASKTTSSGAFDAADFTFTAVTGGSTGVALIFYIDTGTPSTSKLIAYFDTSVTNLPVTTNGGDITITLNAGGLFKLVP